MNARFAALSALIGVVLGALAPGARANPPLFAEGAGILPMADTIAQIAVVDVDRDGDPDVAICHSEGLSWAQNTGLGWVEHPVVPQVELGACFAMDVADFNRDGRVDIAVVAQIWGGVVYQEGVGDTWVLNLIDPDGIGGYNRLAAADELRDGGVDVFVLSKDASRIKFIENTGERHNWTKPTGPVTTSVHGLALTVADITGDSIPDVLTTGASSLGFTYYVSNGTTWSPTTVLASPAVQVDDIAVGDLDGDGRPDVAVAGSTGLAWSQSVGGTFPSLSAPFAPAATSVMALADIDQDGVLDVLHVEGPAGLRMFSLHGGQWQTRPLGASNTESPVDIVAADFDRDGDLDVVVAAPDGLHIHYNLTVHAAARTTRTQNVPGTFAGVDFVAAGDFDRDGDQDLVVSSNTGSNTRLVTGASGAFGVAGVVWSGRLRGEGVSVDFDRDGDLDVVGCTDAGVAWLRNIGTLPWTAQTTSFTGKCQLAVGDVDRDGDPDVVVGSPDTGALRWIENAGWGTSLVTHMIDATFSGFRELALADVDRNGSPDVVVSQYSGTSEQVAWYANSGDGASWVRYQITIPDGPASLTAGDLNGDGVVEVAVVGGGMAWVVAPGGDPTSEWMEVVGFSSESRLALGIPMDLDFDGTLDWTAPRTGFMGWMTLDGESVTAGAATNVAASALEDLDDDGDLDLVAAIPGENRVALWFDDRESVRIETMSVGAPGSLRPAPYEPLPSLELLVTHAGQPEDLPIELLSCGLTADRGGVALTPTELASLVTLTLAHGASGGGDPGEPPLALTTVIDGEKLRFELPIGGVVVNPGVEAYVLNVELGIGSFAGKPPVYLNLHWNGDCAVGTAGTEDGPITRVTHGAATSAALTIGNTLLLPGPVGATILPGGTASWDPLLGSIDPDGDPLSYVGLVSNPSHGTLTDGDGVIEYVNAGDGAKLDVFVYALTDGIEEVWALGVVKVVPAPAPPFATDSQGTTLEDRPVFLTLKGGSTIGAPTFVVVTAPTHGALVVMNAKTGLVRYTPDPNYTGPDSFTFQVTDGTETSPVASVSLTVLESEFDDDDGDGLGDWYDNCREVANPAQENLDHDAMGDACDADRDGDGAPDAEDVCPSVFDPRQASHDGDGLGDACDDDDDGDGVVDAADVCPWDVDAGQEDLDGDGLGDACDSDADGDLIDDDIDVCPGVPDHAQRDRDGDGLGNACDEDDDGDGVADAEDVCPWVADPGQEDADGDGVGDACEPPSAPPRPAPGPVGAPSPEGTPSRG